MAYNRYYLGRNVLEETRNRINELISEFDGRVSVSISGGKDSTVLFYLTMEEMERRGHLPLPVVWLDQECEWQATVDTCAQMMEDPRVRPIWLQVPFRLQSSASLQQPYFDCWSEEKRDVWMREKHPLSIKENDFGTDRFHDLLNAANRTAYPDQRYVSLTGVRADESLTRQMSLLQTRVRNVGYARSWCRYKGGRDRKASKEWRAAPLHDWSTASVWRAIHDHGWPYNRIYDLQYNLGVSDLNQRISSLTHEHAIRSLFEVQELEPETWGKLVRRLPALQDTAHLVMKEMFRVNGLPRAFSSWVEYRDYLLEHLVQNAELRERMQGKFATVDRRFATAPNSVYMLLMRAEITAVLHNTPDFRGLDQAVVNADSLWGKLNRRPERRNGRTQRWKREQAVGDAA